jgi:DNA-binding NarL/FixJ family response regulator
MPKTKSQPGSQSAELAQPRRAGLPPIASPRELRHDGNLPPARSSHSHVVRVLCVDDHAVLVEGLAARFALEEGLELVGRLASAERLVEECDRLKPNVVILDIEMPGPDAFEAADRLQHSQSGARVLVLSAHIRDAFISAAFRAGASAYFSKSDELADIVRGIYEVARSQPTDFLLGPKVRERCRPVAAGAQPAIVTKDQRFTRSAGSPTTLLASLTSREAAILRFIGKGLSRTQIAAGMCRSAKTIDAHQARMMRKLGITSRADLMRFAIREGLAEA